MIAKPTVELDSFFASQAPSPGRVAARPETDSTAIAEFFNYWMSLPLRDGMPDASDFAPSAIVRWLPEVILFELNEPLVATYRLAGTAVVERLGHNPTGSNLIDLLPAERRIEAGRTLHEIAVRPCGLHMRYVNNYATGRIGQVESLYLPLRPPAGGKPRVIAMNTPAHTLAFEANRPRTTVVAGVTDVTWIDIGYGTPCGSQPRP